MGWLIAAIVGGVIGLLFGFSVSTKRRMSWLLNILLGIIGGLLGVWLFFSVLGLSAASAALNFWLLILWSIIGAIAFMAIVDGIAAIAQRSAERREYRMEDRDRMHERGVTHEYEERRRRRRDK